MHFKPFTKKFPRFFALLNKHQIVLIAFLADGFQSLIFLCRRICSIKDTYIYIYIYIYIYMYWEDVKIIFTPKIFTNLG